MALRTRYIASMASLALIAGSLVAAGGATAAFAAEPVAGGQTTGDVLFPNQGNTGYDALHYDLDFVVDVAVSSTNNAVSSTTFREATASIDAATTGAPLSSYSFDFQGSTGNLAAATLNVDSVTVNGAPATFTRIENTTTSNATTDVHKLIVTPATPVEGNFTTVVKYSGKPVSHTDTDGSSEGWNNTTDGATFLNQPVGAMTAFPNNNTPSDKATYDISINIPSKLKTSATAAASSPGLRDAAAVSNGELVSKTPSEDGSRTKWVWEQTKPMGSFLAMISIGRYDTYESDITLSNSGRTIHEWTFIDPAISQANQNTTLATRAQLPQILNFLESKFGPYPGNSTGLVIDVVPSGINYALETQDRSFFPTAASRSTTIHELMHQWYGDSVSPTVWNDIWISEGSATYSEAQTAYESAGSTTTNTESSYFTTWNSSNANSSMWTTPTAGMTLASQLFGSQVYTRGAMTLEALRTVIGTEDFATLMNEWQLRNAGTSKRTADFIALAEEVSGRSLTAFFQSWLYSNTKAAWPAKFNVTLAGPSATVSSGDTASYTLTNRNTGKVPQNGTVISVDVSGILDKATLGTLPAGLTLNGTTLSWAVPSTATSASQSVTFTAVPNTDTAGQTLTATVSDATLGQTCVECSSSTVIAAQPLSPTATPTVTGGTTVGSILTAVTDGWAEGTTFGYQWLVDGTPVPGATASTYTVTGFDSGFGVSVKVTGSKAGSNAVVSTSAATAVITRAALTVGTPTITGSAQFGKPLTVNPGNWTPGTYFTYQWAANGTSVTAANGGTGPQFIPAVATQLGQTITATTTGTKFGYTTQGATSGATAPVEGGVFESTPTPLITGTPRALSALAVDQGAWDRFTTLTNQWYVDGTPVSGSAGTGLTFTPTVAQIGGKVTVTVTGTKAGYPTTQKTSAETAAIGNPVQVLTPTPTISGTVKVDSTLTVAPGTWDSGTTLAYQWFADDSAIEGATDTTLLLTPDLADAVITVKVTSTKTGYEDASKTSAATEKVAKGDLTETPTPSIEGTPKVAVELTAVPGTWDDGVALSYQWSVGDDEVSGATAATFTPRGADAGKTVTVTVTGAKSGYTSKSRTSDPTAEVAEGTLVTTPVPTITGTAKVGVQLTAVPGTWDSATTFGYQWSVDGEAIEGATSSTYTPGASRLGKTLTVAVTGSKEGYSSVTKTSTATAAVIAGDLTPAPNPTITGTAKVGVQLTAVPGTWAADTTLTYQWSVGGVVVADATGTTYTPVVADAAKTVTVSVTGTKTGYTTVTRTSSATVAVAVGDLSSAPVPTISGTPKVAVVLTADAGTWDSGTTLKYQWYVAGSLVPGSTSATFTPAPSALGKAVTVAVTGTKTGFATVTRTSLATENVVRGDLLTTPVPTIIGTAKVDVELTADAGTWDNLTQFSYQWLVDGEEVEGATSATFTPTAAAAGATVTVSVTGTKPGYTPVTTTSEPTAEVDKGDLLATPIPTIAGTPKVDVELSVVTGEWDEDVEFSYQWLVAGVEIEGATESTFVPTADAAGESVSVSVTGTKGGYTAVTVTSEPTENVSVGDLVSTSVPTFSGKVQVASIVKAIAGDWDSGVTLSYQWLRNGVSITGATKSSYKVAPADFGRTLSVVVSGSKPGYRTVAERATASKVIAGVQVHQPKPVIKGTAKVGRTLSVKKALYDSSVTLTYAWFSDGRKVSSKKTLTLGSSLKGTRITVTVTAKKTGYATVAKTSSKTATVKKK